MADIIPNKRDHNAKLEHFTYLRKQDPVGFFNSTKKIIEGMTEITNDHFLTPGVALRLITPNCPTWEEKLEDFALPDPFWAFYWLGGQGLTRYLLDNPELIRGKTVLDVGSGCGSLAIAASKIGGAATITASDICPISAVAIEVNAELNGCKPKKIKIITDNIIDRSKGTYKYDVILVGDMMYDREAIPDIMEWLRRSFKLGAEIYIGDPGRHIDVFEAYVYHLKKVAEYGISREDKKDNQLKSNTIDIWKFIKPKKK